ncbi:hypothetical protein ACFZC3_14565 [Streptomyces sp. NPDC007903]|uniref:hypothetical protein n=1 Tax=Streptomyces sp. NPDC007903 TaxID=3364786 RepID=UPI0036E66E42
MSLFKNPAAGNRARGTAPRRSTRNAFIASAVAATTLLMPSIAVGAPSAGLLSLGDQSSSLSTAAPGRFMLVGSTGSGHIAVYGVSRDGALTKVTRSLICGERHPPASIPCSLLRSALVEQGLGYL